MRIIDTCKDFPAEPSLVGLRKYYEKHPDIFKAYFPRHCKNTDDRLNQAIQKYSEDWDSIKKVHERIGNLIENVTALYQEVYQIEFPIDVNLIIGGYGSNAYTHLQIIPNITFALERLTFDEEPLKVIIAHEFGHASHNIITDQYDMDWKSAKWDHPYTWLLQEGAATHFSKQIVPGLEESIYFSYKYEEEDWLKFAKENKQEIITSFISDMESGKSNANIFREWFSINGGQRFGYSRFGYYIADCMFQDFVERKGEVDTLLLWKEKEFFHIIKSWLEESQS
ncbi:hypothetical protein [Ornithinibacillus californiensis]|uniref:hypothetical protein n=1 Tax=Ornithinibacillus californiensis TaxID=161536 RepID=UPI0007ECB75C|nr:hypothetical protein [Ornithinibacillus californiensis]